ncbi:MAG: hypothetical protein K0R66_1661, partial [Gammaproteobacteria bacterium]|nr:hypothetical protein [Gammaproteobacteria bacterium]
MLAGIQAGLEEIKKYETKANLDEQATALDVSFNRAIIKDFLNALDEYINQSSKSSLEEPNFDVINELGLQLHFSNKIVRQEIIDKLYPGARKIPDDSLIKSVLDRVSNEFPDDLTNIDLSQIELLSEISKKITGEPVKYILNYFIIYHLALKITSLGSADQVLGIINKLFTAKSFKESGLAPYLKGPLDKLDKKVFEANERAQEERHRIKSKLPEKIEISTRAFISAIESALSKIINETKEQAILEKLPEIKDAYIAHKEICREQKDNEKEIAEME